MKDLHVLLFSTQDAARFIGMSESFLEKSRFFRDPNGPPFVRIGRAVRYRRTDLEAWVQAKLEGAQ